MITTFSPSCVIETFDTCQCSVFICDTGVVKFGEVIYACISVHKNDGHYNVRFGNKTQVENMKNVYKRT